MIYYRVARDNDIPRLVEILEELFSMESEFSSDHLKQRVALEQIVNTTLGDIYVCLLDTKIVAMVNILYTISTTLGGQVAILEDMIVDKEYRGQGIGNYFKQAHYSTIPPIHISLTSIFSQIMKLWYSYQTGYEFAQSTNKLSNRSEAIIKD